MDNNQYGTRQVQLELLEMMKDVHRFCIEKEIKYSLSSGSVLGAVRHDGFIPWDDDMDIMVDRENFNKFKNVWNDMNGYKVHRDSLWLYRIHREADINDEHKPTIDIFIMDGVPKNPTVSKIKVFIIKILQGMLKRKVDYENYSKMYRICLKITHGVGKLFTYEHKLKMYDRYSQLGSRDNAAQVSAYNDLFKLLNVKYDGDTMKNLVLHKFEDTEFYIPSNFDSYLTCQYGDYMTPPPEDERVPMHM